MNQADCVNDSRRKKRATGSRSSSNRLLVDGADRIQGTQVLLFLMHGTAVARQLIEARPELHWHVLAFDHFLLESLISELDEHLGDEVISKVNVYCTPDPPEIRFDTVILPTDSSGSSEFVRELLQASLRQLNRPGRLIVSTNNPKDHWLHEYLKKSCQKTTVLKDKSAVCYVSTPKTEIHDKQKNFRDEFAFRDADRLIRCVSRPGVFSHRRLDDGARALTKSLDLLARDPSFRTPQVIAELGCGCGAVTVAAALRFPDARVLGVDSHARAVQCTEDSAALNNAHNVSTMLSSNAVLPDAGWYDLILTNPPYYSNFRISELFLESASESLRPGGRLHLVTKLTEGHRQRMEELFGTVEQHAIGQYHVLVAHG